MPFSVSVVSTELEQTGIGLACDRHIFTFITPFFFFLCNQRLFDQEISSQGALQDTTARIPEQDLKCIQTFPFFFLSRFHFAFFSFQ